MGVACEELAVGGAVDLLVEGEVHPFVALDDGGELGELMVLLGGEVTLLGVDLDELGDIAHTHGGGYGADGRGGDLDEEVAYGLPDDLHIAELGVVDIAFDGYVEEYLIVFVFEHIEGGLEGDLELCIDIAALVAHLGFVDVDTVLAAEGAAVDGVVRHEGEGAVGEGASEIGDRIGADALEVESFDAEHEVLVLFPLEDVAFPAQVDMSAAGELGSKHGIVLAVEGEVFRLYGERGHGELEDIGQGVVGIGEAGVGDEEVGDGEADGLLGLGLDGVGDGLWLSFGELGAVGDLLFLDHKSGEVVAVLVAVEAGGQT